ncbi:MAG: BspA family leucine-rich repeat surface protein, partial [Candidatus Saccharimonadaceae bacterium]|nr:BspA family leucine-rich repeat surface protein [Candidatus Saccharimonadaceae bacterium]
RDNEVYAVAKLADGNYWMIENLRLDNEAELSNANTNNPALPLTNDYNAGTTSNFLSTTSNSWCTDYDSAPCYNQSKLNTNNVTATTTSPTFNQNYTNGAHSSDFNTNLHSYGNYYNWYSATAGRGTRETSNNQVAAGDICPAGWSLPVGGSNNTSGSFYYLNQQMGGNTYTQGSNNWRSFPNNFIYSGYWYNSSPSSRGNYGYYWSSTAESYTSSADYLYFYNSYVGTSSTNKYNGNSVRCVAPIQTTITFDGNGNDGGEMAKQGIAPNTTAPLNSNTFVKYGYAFTGWNTERDGSGTSYADGQDYVAGEGSTNITLYAQWAPATTIIYDGNGGEGGGLTQTIRAGETSSIYGNQGYFSKDGCIISHWNTKPDGSGETYHEGGQFTASDQSTTITLYAQWIDVVILDTGTTVNAKLKRLAGNSSAKYYTEDTNVTTIARAYTLPTDFVPTDDNAISIDGSANPVYAWYNTDTTTIYYYTESDKIIMSPSSSYMFYNFRNLSDATSIADWDTSKVTDMSHMFEFDGRNATTWSIGDLSSWDTSKVTDMSSMFSYAGQNATTWSIGDLSSWDTSEVTGMSGMFSGAGQNATTWSIGDLSSWDTSKVTGMSFMFYCAGRNATTWFIGDLSSWDTSKVTNMSQMFREAGRNATTWSIGDLSSWDTSKVTDMSHMFEFDGRNATTWSIGDLSSWDTSKVTDMSYMFYYAGSNATTFSLDLSSWDTSKVTDMSHMFFCAGFNAATWSIGDLSSWDTSKVTDMSSMFEGVGHMATTFSLDLSSWDTSKVTDMNYMFSNAGYNATTWSITIPQKTGDINNTTSAFYGQDSSIYAAPPRNRSFTLSSANEP